MHSAHVRASNHNPKPPLAGGISNSSLDCSSAPIEHTQKLLKLKTASAAQLAELTWPQLSSPSGPSPPRIKTPLQELTPPRNHSNRQRESKRHSSSPPFKPPSRQERESPGHPSGINHHRIKTRISWPPLGVRGSRAHSNRARGKVPP